MRSGKHGFTLIELLIAIGILAVLAAAAVLILNPNELVKKSRDQKRVSDVDNINKNIDVYHAQGGTFFGSPNTVYISLPHSLSNCYDGATAPIYSLPVLPFDWSYACSDSANYTNADGTGWIPVDLASTPGLSPTKLPVDPINSDANQLYYTYIGGSWSLTARLESNKLLKNMALVDGGTDPTRYESGSDDDLWTTASGLAGYWPMDGSANDDVSGNAGSLGGAFPPDFVTDNSLCKVGTCVDINEQRSYINIAYQPSLALNNSFSVSFWINLDSDPDIGPTYNDYRFLLKKFGGYSPFYIYLEQQRVINFTVTKGASYRYIGNSFSGEQLTVGQWTHLAYSYDSTTGIGVAYKNGVVSRSGPMKNGFGGPSIVPGTLDTNSLDWRISNDPGVYPSSGSGSLPGKLDEFRLYSRALSASEIQAIYNATK